ncbi:hypothetical protein GCM10009692_02000 [Leucobacter aridicollis]
MRSTVVSHDRIQDGRWHEFPPDAAYFISRCRPEELLKTVEMLDVAITWLSTGQLPDGYILQPAYPAERLGWTC